MMPDLYDQDFYQWTRTQAATLRGAGGERIHADIDWTNLAEEIESLGRVERRELRSRFTVLLCHLLKWRFQPARRGNSWRGTIRNQRRDAADHLKDNPSLKAQGREIMAEAYERALDVSGIVPLVF